MKNWRFSTNISLYLENGTRYGHSYNGRPSTADSFAVSCIGLGWVHIFRFAMGWAGLDHSVDGLGWVGSGTDDAEFTTFQFRLIDHLEFVSVELHRLLRHVNFIFIDNTTTVTNDFNSNIYSPYMKINYR